MTSWTDRLTTGPIHHGLQSINSSLFNPLIRRPAGFSIVLMYLNKTSFHSMISFALLFTNTEIILALLIHDKTNKESDHRKQLMVGICNGFFTKCKLLNPINIDNNCKCNIEKAFLGATFNFAKIRLAIGFQSLNV